MVAFRGAKGDIKTPEEEAPHVAWFTKVQAANLASRLASAEWAAHRSR